MTVSENTGETVQCGGCGCWWVPGPNDAYANGTAPACNPCGFATVECRDASSGEDGVRP